MVLIFLYTHLPNNRFILAFWQLGSKCPYKIWPLGESLAFRVHIPIPLGLNCPYKIGLLSEPWRRGSCYKDCPYTETPVYSIIIIWEPKAKLTRFCDSCHSGSQRSFSSNDDGAFGLFLQFFEEMASRTKNQTHEIDVWIFLEQRKSS